MNVSMNKQIVLRVVFSLLLYVGLWVSTSSYAKSVQVQSCGRTVTFDKVPVRAVSHDVNLTEMMFALGLQSSMVGYSGITGWQKLTPEFVKDSKGLKQLTEGYLNLENLLAVNADFLFAGWSYGMKPDGAVTPDRLRKFGIKVYELTESCIRIMKKNPASFADIFNDLRNLGKIFRVEGRSEALITRLKSELASLTTQSKKSGKSLRVFLYDSGVDKPMTAGEYAMPQAMIEAAGGINVMAHLSSSWVFTSWEAVSEKNPEAIVIVDYGKTTAKQKIAFLKKHPALRHTPAIKNNNFVVVTYAEATPGIKSVAATKRMANAFSRFSVSQ